MITRADRDRITLELDRSVYSDSTVAKCMYWHAAKFDIEIRNSGTERRTVDLYPKRPLADEAAVQEMCARLRRDLIDFKLREIVREETAGIRELLLAKAFCVPGVLEDKVPEPWKQVFTSEGHGTRTE